MHINLVGEPAVTVTHQRHRHAPGNASVRKVRSECFSQGVKIGKMTVRILVGNFCFFQITTEAFNPRNTVENELCARRGIFLEPVQFGYELILQTDG
ncbi:MAG TPA: hypothetical protein VGH42_06065 [Verrucomicrobiae bacterium]